MFTGMRLVFLVGLLNVTAWACNPAESGKNQVAADTVAANDSVHCCFNPEEAAKKLTKSILFPIYATA